MVGTVVKCGEKSRFKPGDRVFCSGTSKASLNRLWGAHCGQAIVPDTPSLPFPVPENVDLVDASLAKLAAISYHGLTLAKPLPHEKVVVIGLGPIGQLSARLFAAAGCRVVGADLSDSRVKVLCEAGLEAVSTREGLVPAVKKLLPDGADIVVDATGYAPLVKEAIGLLRELPWDGIAHSRRRYLFQGSYAGEVAIPYGDAFMQEVEFLVPRDTLPGDYVAVLDLMARGKLSARGIVGEVAPPEEAPRIYAAMQAGADGFMTAAFKWNE